ncbi:MAG: TonB-dependent receptor [Gemmatimonadota bacterium]|nr:TonB-dependent receptor [Gemmatimonadota bacterium]
MLFTSLILASALVARPLTASPGDPPAKAAISGRITSIAASPLPDVRVAVVEAGRAVTSDADGRYTITNLPNGTYTIAVSAIGYAPAVRRVVLAGQDITLDVTLKESLIELAPIQVTSTPTATDPLVSPQPTAVLDGENLHAAQAASLGETLNQVAGVHSLSTGAGIGKPVIRGLTSNRVLILDDGQRMETQQWGDEHGPNIETSLADRIEVIRGPASVLYGSDALGGVINIIPKSLPSAEAGRSTMNGVATASYSSNNRQPDGALLLEGATGAVGFRGTVSGRTSEDLRTPDYTLWNSGNRAVGGSGAIGVRQDWGTFSATFSQRNERIQLTNEDPAALPTQRIATSRARLDAVLPVGASRLELSGGYERNRRREFEDDTTTAVALGLLSRNYTLEARLYHSLGQRLNGTVGLSGLRTTFDKFGAETLIPNTDVAAVGVYGFEQLRTGHWDFSAGARYDYRHLSVEQDNSIGVTAQTRNWNAVTGNLGILYRLAEPAAIVLNVGRGFRAPSNFDLFSHGVHEGTVAFERGDSTLKTEKSLNTDLALRLQTTNVALEIGGFVNWVEDFIYTVPTGTTDPGSGFQIYDVTQGNARLAGLEFSGQYHPTRWLHLQGTADYVNGTNTSTDAPLPSIPPFRATYGVRLEHHSRGTIGDPYLSFGGETNARQTRLDPAEASFFSQAFGGAGYQSVAYSLFNAGLGFTLPGRGEGLHVDLNVRNLFDRSYANFLSRIKTSALNPGQGRSVVLRVSTEF